MRTRNKTDRCLIQHETDNPDHHTRLYHVHIIPRESPGKHDNKARVRLGTARDGAVSRTRAPRLLSNWGSQSGSQSGATPVLPDAAAAEGVVSSHSSAQRSALSSTSITFSASTTMSVESPLQDGMTVDAVLLEVEAGTGPSPQLKPGAASEATGPTAAAPALFSEATGEKAAITLPPPAGAVPSQEAMKAAKHAVEAAEVAVAPVVWLCVSGAPSDEVASSVCSAVLLEVLSPTKTYCCITSSNLKSSSLWEGSNVLFEF